MIALVGATGFTGALCARELHRRGLPAVWIARDAAKAARLANELEVHVPRRIASPDDPDALAAALDGCTVVLNTVGPFTELGEPVVRAAIARRAHYVDTTGEQGFMRAMLERHDDAAKAAGVAVIDACAFEYVPGECVATLAVGDGADRVDVYYVTRGAGVSHGTAKSIVRAASDRGFARVGGGLAPIRPRRDEVAIPGDKPVSVVAIPGGEALHLGRHRSVRDVQTWLGLPPSQARWLTRLAPLAPLLRIGALRAMADRTIDRRLKEPTAEERAGARFTVAARARQGDREQWCVVRGQDAYGITAVIAVEGAARLFAQPPAVTGVVSACMAFDAGSLLASIGLVPEGG